jgi:hypothetical protein
MKRSPIDVEDYRWSDKTSLDYTNWNISVDSQQSNPWYDWDQNDPAPYICKKRSKNPNSRLVRMSAWGLIQKENLIMSVAEGPIGMNETDEPEITSDCNHVSHYVWVLWTWPLLRKILRS